MEADSSLVNILPPTSDPDSLDTDKGDLCVRQPVEITLFSKGPDGFVAVEPGGEGSFFYVVCTELFCFMTCVSTPSPDSYSNVI